MKIKVLKTGKVSDIEGLNPGVVWILVEAGIITHIPTERPKRGTNYVLQQQPESQQQNTSTFWVDGEGKDTAIHARCSECKQHEVVVGTENVKFEHCGHIETAPDAIKKQYRKAFSIFR